MKQLPVLQPFAADFLPLLERATDLSKERNEKIHGAIFAEQGQQEEFLFVGWDFKQATPKIRRREVTLDDLGDLGERMEHLNREMVRISARLYDHFGR